MTDHPAPNPNQPEHRHNRVTYTDSVSLEKVDVCSTCGHDFGPNHPDALVEKAARALFENDNAAFPESVRTWENIHYADRDAYRNEARAVLAAVLPEVERRAKVDALRDESTYLRERITDCETARNQHPEGSQAWRALNEPLRHMRNEANRLALRADQIEKGDDR